MGPAGSISATRRNSITEVTFSIQHGPPGVIRSAHEALFVLHADQARVEGGVQEGPRRDLARHGRRHPGQRDQELLHLLPAGRDAVRVPRVRGSRCLVRAPGKDRGQRPLAEGHGPVLRQEGPCRSWARTSWRSRKSSTSTETKCHGVPWRGERHEHRTLRRPTRHPAAARRLQAEEGRPRSELRGAHRGPARGRSSWAGTRATPSPSAGTRPRACPRGRARGP